MKRHIVFYAVMLMLIGIAVLVIVSEPRAAEFLPQCGTTPTPPLEVELPDGTVIPVASLEYRLDDRRIILTGAPRLFCDGYEGH
jgi:hypothetical protein